MLKHLLPAIFFITLLFNTSSSYAIELMKWDRKPLKVDLKINEERMIIFDMNISVGYSSALKEKIRIQSVGGVVYLKALTDITESRLLFKDNDTGKIILIDIKTIKSKNELEPIQIVDDEVFNNQSHSNNIKNTDVVSDTKQNIPIPVLLTRYAAQNFYAPLRTIEPLSGIRNVPTRLPTVLTTLLPGLPVDCFPIMSWQLNEYVVTAIKIKNRSSQKIYLDPRSLQGDFYSATFQHNYLNNVGTPADNTMLYIITEGRTDHAFISEPIVSIGEQNGN